MQIKAKNDEGITETHPSNDHNELYFHEYKVRYLQKKYKGFNVCFIPVIRGHLKIGPCIR